VRNQKENGINEDKKNENFFMMPNEFYEALARIRIPGEARQVLDVIIRKTLGWNKKQDAISLSQFRKKTGLIDKNVIRARKKMLKMNIIATPQKDTNNILIYRLQMDYTKWKPLPKKITKAKVSKKIPDPLPKTILTPLPKKGDTKDIITKEIITKDRKTSNDEIILMKEKIKELKEDLENEKYANELDYKRQGIKDLEGRLEKLKNRV